MYVRHNTRGGISRPNVICDFPHQFPHESCEGVIMRVAVMSDIHGFDQALETVIADLTQRGPFDDVIVAGDLCAVGPNPARVLQLLSASDFSVLAGNTDLNLVYAAQTGITDPESRYVLEQIGEAGVD